MQPVSELPLVSVITPCLNMGRFLEETIQSVLAQDYPRLEYVVMDGASTDCTLDILEKYKHRLRFESRPDRGTADAVNMGFGLTRGEIIAWLSADDTYLPGAVSAAVMALAENPDAGVVYGDGLWVDVDGKPIDRYPTKPFDRELLGKECFICQPAAFIRRETFERAGGLDSALQTCFDYEFWMRVAKVYPMVKIDRYLAASRMHPANKTIGRRKLVYGETFQILRKHYNYVPFRWLYDYACWVTGKRREFLGPFQASLAGFVVSLFLGLWHNRSRPLRFLCEWISIVRTRAQASR